MANEKALTAGLCSVIQGVRRMESVGQLRHTRDRIVAVDVLRVLLGLSVMVYHLSSWGNMGGVLTPVVASFIHGFVGSASAAFFLLAGYFACRNISWKKALDNSFWCFAPFVLWNGVNIALLAAQGALPVGSTWYSLFGVDDIFCGAFSLREGNCAPLNGPLWFMRDLTLLFLLSPLLYRAARWLFPLLLALSFVPVWAPLFTQAAYVYTLSPFSLALFTAGCFLRHLSEGWQQNMLAFCSPWYMLGFVGVNLCLRWAWGVGSGHCLLFQLLAFWALYQFARWVELHSVQARRLALALAPVTFLTFATHHILWPYLPFRGTDWVLLCPFALFALLTLAFRVMKRWARPLLHLVAHYKLRADDVKASQIPSAQRNR